MITVMNQEKNMIVDVNFLATRTDRKKIVCTVIGVDVINLGTYESEERAMSVIQEAKKGIEAGLPVFEMPEK